MDQSAASGVLLMMLSTGLDRAVVPFDPEALLGPLCVVTAVCHLIAVEYCNGHGRRMDAPFTLGRRDALEAMTASLVVDPRSVLAFKVEDDLLMPGSQVDLRLRAVLSTLALGEAAVGLSQLGDEQAGVFTALGGTDFDGTFLVGRHRVSFH